MPDYEEDRIACFIKTLVEKRIGPTWHVLVGRYLRSPSCAYFVRLVGFL